MSETSVMARALRGFIRLYQLLLSPYLGGQCRYLPTCSDYAMEALDVHGAWRGSWLTLGRLARCHPAGGSGLDPVPPAHVHHAHCDHRSLPATKRGLRNV
ncbi:MAG TPA: membrane protein insertion efficiency factor YidD [Candidatus Cybelea sp.]|nr:membrane protein insertion efficiency factor YidD [Candidatus Cybelea sp.]